MTISPFAFSVLIVGALLLVVAAPLILLTLLVRDWRSKKLW
jgi:hypothetical protein